MRPVRLGEHHAVLFSLPTPAVLLQEAATKARLLPLAVPACTAIDGSGLGSSGSGLVSADATVRTSNFEGRMQH